MKKLTFLLIIIFTLTLQVQAKEFRTTNIEELVEKISSVLRSQGIQEFYLIGGTAQAVATRENIRDLSFQFRDFDIAIVDRRSLDYDFLETISKELAAKLDGDILETNFKDRIRGAKINGESRLFLTGLGSFVNLPQGEIDISLFSSHEYFNGNGLGSADRIKVKISTKEKWELSKMQVLDADGGLTDLNKGINRIVNWHGLGNKPHVYVARYIRKSLNFDLKENELTESKMQRALKSHSGGPVNLPWVMSNLNKILNEPYAVEALRLLNRMDYFLGWAEDLSKFISSKSDSELEAVLKEADRSLKKFSKLWVLVEQSTPLKKRIPFIKGIAEFSPELFMARKNTFLSDGKRTLTVAYFTGDFGPFHRGHESVIESAIKLSNVDIVFPLVIPHPREGAMTAQFNLNEWRERVLFTQLGLDSCTSAIVLPLDKMGIFDISTKPGTQDLIDWFDNTFGRDKKLTIQVAGADSLIRLERFGYLQTQKRERVIVTRPGVEIPGNLQKKTGMLHIVENLTTHPISSTEIMQEVAILGKSANLRPLVLDAVNSSPRYQRLFRDIRNRGSELSRASLQNTKNKPSRAKIFFINPYRVVGDETPLKGGTQPNNEHINLIEKLLTSEANAQVYILGQEGKEFIPFKKTWQRFLRKHGLNSVNIVDSLDRIDVREKTVVHLFHAGDALREHGQVSSLLKSGAEVAMYGAEVGLPSIYNPQHFKFYNVKPTNEKRTNIGPISCRRLFQAVR